MMKPSQSESQDEVQQPALIRPGHIQRRTVSAVAGSKEGWEDEDESPLHAAFCRNKIDYQEHLSGRLYREYYERMGRSGKDSTQLSVVCSGGSTPFTQTQVDAIRVIEKIEAHLEGEYRIIIRKFCGERYEACEAIRAAGHKNSRQVWDKMRLALSKLTSAILRAKISHETPSND